jgi:C-22 sterol desaturase
MNNFASHTVLRPTSVNIKELTAWGIDSLNRAKFTFDTYVELLVRRCRELPKQFSDRLGSLGLLAFADARSRSKTTAATILTVIISLLIYEQVNYRAKKAHLPGANWTIPIIGKFADSLHPTLEKYKKQWASGALSAVSVFNM